VDALAEIIGDQMGMKEAGFPLADAYLKAIGRVQALLETPTSESQSVN
jgi:hypothetical protein